MTKPKDKKTKEKETTPEDMVEGLVSDEGLERVQRLEKMARAVREGKDIFNLSL